MSSTYELLVQSAEGILWKPGPLRHKRPNLCVAVYKDDLEVHRTRAQRGLEPHWNDLSTISADSSSSRISLRLWHDSALPCRDVCLGVVDISFTELLDMCIINTNETVVSLQLKGIREASNAKPTGTVFVRLTRQADVKSAVVEQARRDAAKIKPEATSSAILKTGDISADSPSPSDTLQMALGTSTDKIKVTREADVRSAVVEQARRDAAKIKPEATSSAVLKTGDIITDSPSASDTLQTALGTLTDKIKVLVDLGDKIATIHPYVNIAWTVLTSVYKAAKQQQETDEKLLKLVDTMAEVHSFVEDTAFLDQLQLRIQSVEDKTLAIVQQTVECAYFIQEYVAKGFWSRAIRSTWAHADQKIDELATALLGLRDDFEGRLAVQSVFLSTKILGNLDNLDRSDTLKKLNQVDMNAASRPSCLPGTRIEILDQINGWLSKPSDSGNVLWLCGVAGSGKSTISTSVSESFRGLERLGAYLFFDRNDQVRSNPDGVIRTLAYELAQFNAHIASAISTAIHRDPGIVKATIQKQFKALLLDPLNLVQSSIQGPITIILDALDECGDPSSRAVLLSVLSIELLKLPQTFRFLITSREEKDITDYFQPHFSCSRKQLDVSLATPDIAVFIDHEIGLIRKREGLGSVWPGQSNMQQLVDLSGGLFIWASTATKFIAEYDPDAQLQILLSQNTAGSFNLDQLYAMALRNSGPWDRNKGFISDACAVLACMVLGRVPMTDDTMGVLLGLQAARVLKHLGCVVQWSPGTQARTLHASFADYLTDPSRSGKEPWAIDTNTHHRALAMGCFQVLKKELRFNICGLEDSHVLNANVPDISKRLEESISPQLSYSSRFWSNHLWEAPFDQLVLNELNTFLRDKFLYWLEVLSLLSEVPAASAALRAATQYIRENDEDLKNLIADTLKFMSAFAPIIAQSTPHIYLSALAFVPKDSGVLQQFQAHFPRRLDFHGPLGMRWPSLQKQLRGHSDEVESVCFSRDGTKVVSGSRDKTVRIWDAETGVLVMEPLLGHTDGITSIDLSLDGSRIASGSDDHTVCVWDILTGALILGPLVGHKDSVWCVSFSPDGTHIASGSTDHTVRIWDAKTGALVASWENYALSVHFSPNGKHIASGSWNTVIVWDVQTGVEVMGPLNHPNSVACVNFSLDGVQITSGCRDHMVRVWDAQTGAPVLGPLAGHTDWVTSVHFSPDSTRIASGSDDKTVRLWDAKTGDALAALEAHTRSIKSIHFSPNGDWIASGSSDQTIHIWDAQAQSEPVRSVEPSEFGTSCITFSPNSDWVADGSDQQVSIWDLKTGALVAGPFVGHSELITHIQFSQNGSCIASSSFDRTVRVWDVQTGLLIAGPMEHRTPVYTLGFSTHGEQITTISEGMVRVWDAQTAVLLLGPTKLDGHPDASVGSYCFSRDGTHLAGGFEDGNIHVWDSHTGALVPGPLEGSKERVDCLDFSPDNALLGSGLADGMLHIWDAQTGTLIQKIRTVGSVWAVDFSSDGTHIVSGTSNGTLCIWESHTGSLLLGLEGHTDGISSVRFSPDDMHIASASIDGTIRIWDIQSGVRSPRLFTSHAGADRHEPAEIFNPWGNCSTFDRDTGWVVNNGAHMFWVPPWFCEGLYFPRNTLVIQERGTTKLDLTRFVHGLEWQNCIDPEFRDRK